MRGSPRQLGAFRGGAQSPRVGPAHPRGGFRTRTSGPAAPSGRAPARGAAHLPPPPVPRGAVLSHAWGGGRAARVCPPPPPRARPPSPPRSPAALRQSPGPAVDGQPGPGGAASLTSRSGICMGCGAAAAAQCLSVRRRELPEPEPRSAAAGSADARLGPSRAQHGAAGGGRARLRRGEHREEADPKGAEGRRRGGGEGAAGGRRVPLNAVSLPPALRRAEWSTW